MKFSCFLFRDQYRTSYIVTALALLLAAVLSILSWMRICTEACAAGHNYRLFGFTFEEVGVPFFLILLCIHLYSYRFSFLQSITGLLLCAAFGAELMFMYAQKYIIGVWCPVCLLIAASVAIATFSYSIPYYIQFKIALKKQNKGQIMNAISKSFFRSLSLLFGFTMAFVGLGEYNQLEAAESSFKENLVFGSGDKAVSVYVFTDWRCPSCRSLEPVFEEMVPIVTSKANLVFVDDPVHPETMNFTPYNLSFIVHNKSRYFALRDALTELSKETKAPTEEQVKALAVAQGVSYIPLDYADVALANLYFAELIKKFNVEGTPIVVVENTTTHKTKKLSGRSEISQESILKAIDKLSSK